MRRRYHWKSIQFLITASFALITVVVMLIVSIFVYEKFAATAEQNAIRNNQQIIDQVKFNLESYLDGLGSFFTLIEGQVSNPSQVTLDMRKDQLQTMLLTRNDIVSLALFTMNGQLVESIPQQRMRSNTGLADQTWFRYAATNPDELYYSAPHVQNLFAGSYKWVVSLSKSMEYQTEQGVQSGILLLDANFKMIDNLGSRVTLGSKGYVYLIDGLGNIVYHPQQQLIYSGLKYENVDEVLKYTYGSYIDKTDGQERLITVKTVDSIGWKVVGVSYLDDLVTSQQEISQFMIRLMGGVLLVVLVISLYVSARISNPIKRLERTMKMVEKGVFQVHRDKSGAEEVRQLSKQFNLMVGRIHQLMDQIIAEQEIKRKKELDILQAQIHPHFLYNTLNAVVRLAGSGRNDEVVTTISSLSKFFRISLSGGKQVITVQEELEHVRHYLIIQQIRFRNKFTYEIESDESVLSLHTMKLILQPLVENAIIHGLQSAVDEGHIHIQARSVDQQLVYTITDNGAGIPPKRLQEIILGQVESAEGSGVGLHNVHERLRLYYGDGYGLEIESEPDEGTCVTLRLPQVREGES